MAKNSIGEMLESINSLSQFDISNLNIGEIEEKLRLIDIDLERVYEALWSIEREVKRFNDNFVKLHNIKEGQ